MSIVKRTCLGVTFYLDHRSISFPPKIPEKSVREIYKKEKGIQEKRVDVVLCSDYKIRKLNKKYRNRDRTTDVLSFPFNEDDFLGEIYISLQRAVVQARRYSHSYVEELNRLFIHGMFHLLGFDDENEKDRKIMEQHEKRYL